MLVNKAGAFFLYFKVFQFTESPCLQGFPFAPIMQKHLPAGRICSKVYVGTPVNNFVCKPF